MENGEDEILMHELKKVVESSLEENLLFKVSDILEAEIECTKQFLIAEIQRAAENVARYKHLVGGRTISHTPVFDEATGKTTVQLDQEGCYAHAIILQHQSKVDELMRMFVLLHDGSTPSVSSK